MDMMTKRSPNSILNTQYVRELVLNRNDCVTSYLMSFIAHNCLIKTKVLLLYLESTIKGGGLVICKDRGYHQHYIGIQTYLLLICHSQKVYYFFFVS